MNENQNITACAVKEEPKIKALLSYQTDLYNRIENRHKDLYDIIERLDVIANKLNSVEYPKNFSTLAEISTRPDNANKPCDPPARPDGLIGLLIEHNERDNEQYQRLSDRLIPALYDAVAYIEKHI